MGMITRWLGGKQRPAAAPLSQLHSQIPSELSQQLATSQTSTRRELLRVVLRDTMHRQGIPSDWIAAEAINVTSRAGERGVHWRLLVKHWDARLLTHSVALQNALVKRVMQFDPIAYTWLHGISWQFALADESACPALPHPGSWTAGAHASHAAAPAPSAAGGVIEGPVRIADTQREGGPARADLDQLLASRDRDFAAQGADANPRTWASTEPARL